MNPFICVLDTLFFEVLYMRIGIVHFSDFHVKENEHFLDEKIQKIQSALNVLGQVDGYVMVFTGDLSNSGKINEFKQSRYIISRLISIIKEKNSNNFVNLCIVPGNHDLSLPKECRDCKAIQSAYKSNEVEKLLPTELNYLNNFYEHSSIRGHVPVDKIINKKFLTFDGYTIQFNLINTAPFSTLSPDDKELHYFPNEKMYLLEKGDDVDLCITVMHHSCESFNWKYKSDLEKTIVDNSEFVLCGHDHIDKTMSISIDNSMDTWISAAGEMKLSVIDYEDSFNTVVIDTEKNNFCGYSFTWNNKPKIYEHKILVSEKSLQNHTNKLRPLHSFITELKEDTYNMSDDFTKYFVFPKMVAEDKNQFGKHEVFTNMEELISIISEKNRVLITGATNSGKTTLMKYLYCNLCKDKIPLFLSVDTKTKINPHNFIKRLFEEQYGDDSALYLKYQQEEKGKKVLLVDGWDILTNSKHKKTLLKVIEEQIGIIVFSASTQQSSVVESIKDELNESNSFYEIHIKPFFTEKRNELVRNICLQKNAYNDSDVENVNKLIDSLVHNNSGLFSLNPAFIIRYTNYFIQSPYQDYTKGEAVFSKIFEYELNQSIISLAKKSEVSEIMTTFEEIAGYMYENKKDVIQIEELKNVIETYNEEYGVSVKLNDILEIGTKAKIFKKTEDLSIYFYNKNHLAYFIAKYLIRITQDDSSVSLGIDYALKNICFGINADIILFISYLMNNTKLIMSISEYAGELLTPWETLNFDTKNILMLHSASKEPVSPPSDEERKDYENVKEESEETDYEEEVVEARGLFEYDDGDIDKYPFRLKRAIKYTEMICKALPAFNSSLKVNQKRALIESIYMYPRKIVYAMLRPLDVNKKEICSDILQFINDNDLRKKNGGEYTERDVEEMVNDTARATMLGLFNHFIEISTSPKSYSLLMEKEETDITEQLMKLMVVENSGNLDLLIKEAESLLKLHKNTEFDIMIKLIVRKYLLVNKNLPFAKKQQMIDKIFGQWAKKELLLP